MADSTNPNLKLFDFKKIVNTSDIRLTASVQNPNFDLLAFVVRNGDIVLYFSSDKESNPVLRWIPWFDDVHKRIQAMTFRPNDGCWLLLICRDGSLYVLPTWALLGLQFKENCPKIHEPTPAPWQNADITKVPVMLPSFPDCCPMSVVWWYRNCCLTSITDIAVAGMSNGSLIVVCLTSSTLLVVTKVEGAVVSLDLLEDDEGLSACVVVTNDQGRQWRLQMTGTAAPLEQEKVQTASSKMVLFQGLKQRSVDAMANLKQKLSDSKGLSKPVTVGLPLECHEGDSARCGAPWSITVRLQPVAEVQLAVLGRTLSILHPANLLSIEYSRKDSSPPQTTIHKLPDFSPELALTELFFVSASSDLSSVRVISRYISQCHLDSNKESMAIEFNSKSLIQRFDLLNQEKIMRMYCTNYSQHRCLVVTNRGLYRLWLREDPWTIVRRCSFLSAEDLKLGVLLNEVFHLELGDMICEVADQHLERGDIVKAESLYRLCRCGHVRHVVMLAVKGHVPQVLQLLQDDRPGISKPSLSIIKFLAFVHQYLTNHTPELEVKFNRLLSQGGFDEALAVSVLSQAGLCKHLLDFTIQRGLQPVTVVALGKVLQHTPAIKVTMRCPGFWELLSEYSLCEALLSQPKLAVVLLNFVKNELANLDELILLRFEKLLNPFRVALRPILNTKFSSQSEVPLSLWVQVYLSVCIYLSAKKKDICLTDKERDEPGGSVLPPVDVQTILESPHRSLIGAGYSHCALILHNTVYCWGTTAVGCLGSGPSCLRVSGPTMVDLLPNVGVRPLSISSGRSHTVVLTDNGVYTWGSNRYGQLGLGRHISQSWFPSLVEALNEYSIIHVTAGQYHCIAITSDFKVWTWGWGVHGQLGHGDIEDCSSPKLVGALADQEICDAAAGHAHSLFLDRNGNVWACGSSVFGQLGSGTNVKTSIPQQIYGISEKVVFITTKYFHNLAIADSARVYQWGCSPNILRAAAHAAKRKMRSQENPGAATDNQICDDFSYLSPTLVDTSHVSGQVIWASTGSEHSALLTEDGQVFTWGRNMDGQLGNTASPSQRRSQHILHPTLVSMAMPIKHVECGFAFTVALDQGEKVWVWGANLHTPGSKDPLSQLEGEIVVLQNRRRVIKKLPHSGNNCQPVPSLLSLPILHTSLLHSSFVKQSSRLQLDSWLVRMYHAIETLQSYYDYRVLLKKCSDLLESRAGSKLAQLNGDITTAIKLQLSTAQTIEEKKQVLRYYLSLPISSPQELSNSLRFILQVWRDSSHNFSSLEDVFSGLWDQVAVPLGRILLDPNEGKEDLLQDFSNQFNLRLIVAMMAAGEKNLDLLVPGAENVQDAINAIRLADNYIDIS